MEELYCAEVPACSEGPIALQDPVLLHDSRVLTNLLQLQPFTMPAQNYFKHIQSDIQPYMRKVVTRWMLDVSMSKLIARFEFETVKEISELPLGIERAFPRVQTTCCSCCCDVYANKTFNMIVSV